MRHKTLGIVVLCVGVASSAAAEGVGPSPYLCFSGCPSDSPFNGTSFEYFHLEDFEDLALNTPGVMQDGTGGSPQAPNPITDSVDRDDGFIDRLGRDGASFFWNFGSGTGFAFTFDETELGGLPTHAGIVWTDGGLGPPQTTFEAYGPGMVLLGTVGPSSTHDGTYNGGTAEDRFFGWIDPGGILHIKIRDPGSPGVGIEADHLQYGRAAGALPPVMPMTVESFDPATQTIRLSWDASTCDGGAVHHVVFGFGSQLPATLGGTYTPDGGECGIGNSPPFDWLNTPDPATDVSNLLWWVLVTNDAASTEGPWGTDGSSGERSGPGQGGSSGECGMTDKDLGSC